MTEPLEIPKKTARDKAELMLQMAKEAKRVERRVGANACVVICFFEEVDTNGVKQITMQDAGQFPMAPDQFYELMVRAHQQGLLDKKPKPRIIRPN